MSRPKGGNNVSRTCGEKEQLILEYYESGVGYKRFALSHGISPSLFNGWLKKYQEGGVEALRHSGQKVLNLKGAKDEEILELKLIIANQKIEIERLKKLMNE